MKICISCKAAIPKNASHCPNCGARIKPARTKVYFAKKSEDAKKPMALLVIIITISILAVLGLGYFAFNYFDVAAITLNKNAETPVVYITKNGDMNFVLPKDTLPNLIKTGSSIDTTFTFSPDNQYLLYLDENASLYLRNVNTADANAISAQPAGRLVATDVSPNSFFMTNDSKYIVYKKSDDSLYYNDFEKEVLVASSVYKVFNTNADKLYFLLNDDFDAYSNKTYAVCMFDFLNPANGSLKIETGINEKFYISDNGDNIIFAKSNNLIGADTMYNVFSFSVLGGQKLLVSDVILENANPNTSELFYRKPNETQLDATAIIFDDKKDTDAILQNPDYDTFAAGFVDTEDELYDAYYKALLEYYDKVARDELRRRIQTGSSLVFYDLFFMDKSKQETTLATNIYNLYSTDFKTKTALFTQVDISKMEKISLNDILNLYNCSLHEAVSSNLKVVFNYVKSGTAPTEILTTAIDPSFATAITHIISDKGYGYILARETATDAAHTLYYIDFANPSQPVQVATNVFALLETEINSQALFFADSDAANQTASLFAASKATKTHLGDNVYLPLGVDLQKNSALLYFTNYNNSMMFGTLNSYSKALSGMLDTDVSDYVYQNEGYVYILKSNGELYLQTKTESILVATDVAKIQ